MVRCAPFLPHVRMMIYCKLSGFNWEMVLQSRFVVRFPYMKGRSGVLVQTHLCNNKHHKNTIFGISMYFWMEGDKIATSSYVEGRSAFFGCLVSEAYVHILTYVTNIYRFDTRPSYGFSLSGVPGLTKVLPHWNDASYLMMLVDISVDLKLDQRTCWEHSLFRM